MTMYVLGIDQGLDGAIALVDGENVIQLHDIPSEPNGSNGQIKRRVDAAALRSLIRSALSGRAQETLIVMEAQQSFGMEGRSSLFWFGETVGVIRGLVAGYHVAPGLSPNRWKRAYGLLGEGKDSSIDVAKSLYPSAAPLLKLKKHHNRADAILIAQYGWQNLR